MPELPDLTLFAENLKKSLLHQTVTDAQVYMPAKVNVPASHFREKTVGLPLSDIRRAGKEMLFKLTGRASFSVHLMLRGAFSLHTQQNPARLPGMVLAVSFADGQVLVVSDDQSLCKVTLNPIPPRAPDVLSDAFTYDFLWRALRKARGKKVKTFLLDQAILRGIGNAYADEILYAAHISPLSLCGSLPDEAVRALYDAIPVVLSEALETLRMLTPDAIRGETRGFLKVHNPRLGITAAGERIYSLYVAGRHTYYVEEQVCYSD